jgi:hypothetical protein
LTDNPQLRDLSGLSELTEVSGQLEIHGNAVLQSLAGLNSLVNVGGVEMSGNPELRAVSALSGLTTIRAGGLHITNNPELSIEEGLRVCSSARSINGSVHMVFSDSPGAPLDSCVRNLGRSVCSDGDLAAAVASWRADPNATALRYGDINTWDTSQCTQMNDLDFGPTFNEPLSGWTTSRVVTMSAMFWNARTFNQPLITWDTSSVNDMSAMFYNAVSFNAPISFDTSAVASEASMQYMVRS